MSQLSCRVRRGVLVKERVLFAEGRQCATAPLAPELSICLSLSASEHRSAQRGGSAGRKAAPPRGCCARSPPYRDWYFIAEQLAPTPHLVHPDGCAVLRIVLVTVPRVSHVATLHARRHTLHPNVYTTYTLKCTLPSCARSPPSTLNATPSTLNATPYNLNATPCTLNSRS